MAFGAMSISRNKQLDPGFIKINGKTPALSGGVGLD